MLVSGFVFGAAQILTLPPWEGFDEYAHWSYVQQIHDTGRVPRLGVDMLSQDVARYPGPYPYGNGAPPFADPSRPSYRSYTAADAALSQPIERRYEPGPGLNWQAQHPPLFYALMAPIYAATKGLSWIDHLAALRLVCWTAGFAGLAAVAIFHQHSLSDRFPWAGLVTAAYPFYFPQFIPEIARLGNDSLCVLLASGVWVAVAALLDGRSRRLCYPAIAILLCLGVLTKAFFVPLTAGVVVLLALNAANRREPADAAGTALVIVASGLVASSWYLRSSFEAFGYEFRAMENPVGILRGLVANFSLGDFVRRISVIAATFSLAGTWSLARVPLVLIAAPLLFAAWSLARWGRDLFRRPTLVQAAPAFLLLPLVGGLLFHALYGIASPEQAVTGTPGWYLHILAGPIAYVIVCGWSRVAVAFAGAATLSGLAAWGLRLALYSGCATKSDDKLLSFKDAVCVVDIERLGRLCHVRVGMAAAVVGWAILAMIAYELLRPSPSAGLAVRQP